MIFWEEYKKLKVKAEKILSSQCSDDFELLILIREFQTGKFTKEQAIEEAINILSGGEHFKPL